MRPLVVFLMSYESRMEYWWLLVVVVLFLAGCGATTSQWKGVGPVSAFETQMLNQGLENETISSRLSLEADNAAVVGNTHLAIDYAKRAKHYTPTNAMIWYQLAQLYLQQEYYKEAEASALRTISLSKNNRRLQAKGWRLIEQSRLLLGGESHSQYAGHRAAKLER
ncbi:hypothetical protein MNBD_GAMMA18-758 [hydrothermal vent metagenome]|uniref:Uncharacterized protein n=1 Tax=hydrothermal vent metagenome TaxID=652676 RepID=A0A3B0ZTA8_9ZZZZ